MHERVGRYELLSQIASGGMATVFRARLTGVQGLVRVVALKMAHTDLSKDPRFVSDLMHEARVMAAINHPNVVPVLDAAVSDTSAYIVMDFVRGGTLAALMRSASGRGHRIPQAVALRILADALSGLHAAHELKRPSGRPADIVHRDFTPHNILVGIDGIARLTDFGIAQSAIREERTAAGVLKGKESYLAPEQVRGERVDRRCDVWAGGVIAWELIAGRKLYSPGRVRDLLAGGSSPPPRLSDLGLVVPRRLELAVARSVSEDPNRRYATARDLARALSAAAGDLASTADVADYVKDVLRARDHYEGDDPDETTAIVSRRHRAMQRGRGPDTTWSHRAAAAPG